MAAKYLFRFFLFILAHFALSYFVICKYQIRFDFSPKLVWVHLLLLGMFHLALLGFGLILMRSSSFRSNDKISGFLALYYGLTFYLLTVIYLLSFVSQQFWGANITLSMTFGYIADIQNFIQSLPVKPAYFYGFALGHLLLVPITFYLFRKVIFNGILALHDLLFRNDFLSWKTAAGKVFFTLIIAVLGLASWKGLAVKRYIHKLGDPVLNTVFGPYKEFHNFTDPRSVAIALEEKRIEAAYPVVKNFDKKNIIYIIADALRADYLPSYGYPDTLTPFLSRMIHEGQMKQVKSVFSTCPDSHCGIISSLASKDWKNLGIDNFFVHDLLKKQGYQINFILSGSHLDWYNLYKSYGENIDFYFDGYLTKNYGINDDRLLFEGLDSVGTYSGKPAFFYFHFMSTHIAGLKFKAYERFTPTKSRLDNKLFQTGQYDSKVLVNNYKNGIIQMDAMLEDLFEALDQKGYLQNSIIFIFGDHGDAFGEHDHFGHVFQLYQEDLSIPMFIYDRDSTANYQNLEFATQMDISPTVMDRLGLPIPSSWQGRSLLLPDTARITYHQSTLPKKKTFGFVDKTDSSLIKCIYKEKTQEILVFDLIKDPKELTNLWSSLPERTQQIYKERLEDKFEMLMPHF